MSDRSAALTDVIVMCDERVPPVDDRWGIGFPRQIFHLEFVREKTSINLWLHSQVDAKKNDKRKDIVEC